MNSSRPLIAVTSSDPDRVSVARDYFDAIWKAGGMPVALPYPSTDEVDWVRIEAYADSFSGFLFTGGGDVDPKYYQEPRDPRCGPADPARDAFELALASAVMLRRKPVLGICRGIQLINVSTGGSLFQHIPGHCHTDEHPEPVFHSVKTAENSLLRSIMGEEILRTNSTHHQAVKATGKGVIATGEGPKGWTEAIEFPGYPFFLGIQWHPEVLLGKYGDRSALKIFSALVEAAKKQENKDMSENS